MLTMFLYAYTVPCIVLYNLPFMIFTIFLYDLTHSTMVVISDTAAGRHYPICNSFILLELYTSNAYLQCIHCNLKTILETEGFNMASVLNDTSFNSV